jgi:hypothetical protein
LFFFPRSPADLTNNATPAGGSVMPGSRIGPFAMPACPLQPDLDLLHKFRQKENEYSRERNASPFRWIDRYRPRSTLFFFLLLLSSLPSSSPLSSLWSSPTLYRRGCVGTARRGGRPSLSQTAMIPQTKILRYGRTDPRRRSNELLTSRRRAIAIVCFYNKQDLLGEGGNPAHSSSRSVARELIRYEPRQIQPAKLAEKLAREYKKWHTVCPTSPPPSLLSSLSLSLFIFFAYMLSPAFFIW